jgi:uncharacterized protein
MNCATLLLSAISFACTSGGIEGRWTAEARTPGEAMTLILDVEAAGARISVPAERVLGMSVTELELEPPALAFRIPHPDHPMRFAGRAHGDGIEGVLSAFGEKIPLSFRRSGEIPVPPYREVRVSFEGAGRSVEGELLLPPGKGPHPAVAWFHATSTAHRDYLRFHADLAARAGMAALIYDRRDVPVDLARMSRADFLDVVADAEAAARFLRDRSEIDHDRVGVGGLSQGAWIAAIVATRVPDVRFVAALSCPGLPLHEIDVHQSTLRLERLGLSASALAEARGLLVDLHAATRGECPDAAALGVRLSRGREQPWASTLDLPEQIPSAGPPATLLRWSALDLDPRQFFEKIDVPVLLAFGGRDERLPATLCAERLRSALAENTEVSMLVYPEANHALLPAPQLDRDLAEWLVRVIGDR